MALGSMEVLSGPDLNQTHGSGLGRGTPVMQGEQRVQPLALLQQADAQPQPLPSRRSSPASIFRRLTPRRSAAARGASRLTPRCFPSLSNAG